MKSPLKTVLIGCGQVAAGYGFDQKYAQFYRYATHAQVLAEHPDFNWVAAVDPSAKAWQAVVDHYPSMVMAASLAELPDSVGLIDVAVIATPPDVRLSILKQLPESVEIIIVEKPLGQTVAECEEFLAAAAERGIAVHVNLWRRSDELHQRLSGLGLAEKIGELQGMSAVYSGGLHTTATHLVDWFAMVAGRILSVQALAKPVDPGASDPSYSFMLTCASGVAATFLAIDVKYYRELTIDLWGTKGRVTIGNEALAVEAWGVGPHRVMAGDWEIAADMPGESSLPTVGEAFYRLYTNVAEAQRGTATPVASGEMALQAARVIEAIQLSAKANGQMISV